MREVRAPASGALNFEYPKNLCIHQLLDLQVERTPDNIAVIFEEQQITYRELNRRANQLAHYLRTLQVGPDVLVGICMKRSLLMVIGLLGILKAGGAYVPLDPAYPKERLAMIIEDSQFPVLLSEHHQAANLPNHRASVVCLDTDWEAIAQHRSDEPNSRVTPELTQMINRHSREKQCRYGKFTVSWVVDNAQLISGDV